MLTIDEHREIGKIKLPKSVITDWSAKEFYLAYKHHVGNNKMYKMSYMLHRKITFLYLRKVVGYLLDENVQIKTSPSIGSIGFQRCPAKTLRKRMINFCETRKRKFPVYYLNEHTNGDIYKTRWIKPTIPFSSHYLFNFADHIKKKMSENVLNNIRQYH